MPSVQIPIVDIVFDFENNYQFMVAKPLILDLKAIYEQSAMNVCYPASKDFSNNQDRKCWMKWCLIHEMLGCIYAHLVLEVGLRDLDKSLHISYLYIENF